MGNCQAIDAASLVIQHPSGKVEKLYWPILANEVMRMNPDHYVVLLLSTTLYSPPPPPPNNINNNNINETKSSSSSSSSSSSTTTRKSDNCPVRLTKIKLLRPTDTLSLGHAYRLIPAQEVMKGLKARKQAKVKKGQVEAAEKPERAKEKKSFPVEEAKARTPTLDKINQVVRNERNPPPPPPPPTTTTTTKSSNHSSTARSRTWQPSLHSILEAGS